jgi:hypothetical protein
MKSDFILNVDISSSKKLSTEEFEFFKEEMESNFPFNEFFLILLENSELEKNGTVEIYVEDLEMEFDLTGEIESILSEMDLVLRPLKGSKIEWYSSRGVCNIIWSKTSNGWEKSEEEGETDFYEESFFGFED